MYFDFNVNKDICWLETSGRPEDLVRPFNCPMTQFGSREVRTRVKHFEISNKSRNSDYVICFK